MIGIFDALPLRYLSAGSSALSSTEAVLLVIWIVLTAACLIGVALVQPRDSDDEGD